MAAESRMTMELSLLAPTAVTPSDAGPAHASPQDTVPPAIVRFAAEMLQIRNIY
jgi:hypothetical protein